MSYSNLIQGKRTKMLYLVVLLLFYNFLNVTSINLTYLVKNDNVLSPSCIAEELERYEGIGWIYPIPETPQNVPSASIVTKFLPAEENNFDCKFSKDSRCNILWTLRNWQIDTSSLTTGDVITDSRWEDLPTISVTGSSNDLNEKVELENVSKQAFSVRAGGIVELFLCSDSNPHDSPCYYFLVNYTDIYLRKYSAVPQKTDYDEIKKNYAEHSKASRNILSKDEWRTFVVNWNESGFLQLFDHNLNRILIEFNFKESLNPTFMFMKSGNASLWKMHQSSYMYTNASQISRLGPMLHLSNKNLCVSLLVKVCSLCEIKFFFVDKIRINLTDMKGTKSEDWVEVKLKYENFPFDKINLFVETVLANSSLNGTNGFWAIDNVRVCYENEVKVSFLKLNATENVTSDDIWCAVAKRPNWRPKKLAYNKISGNSNKFAPPTITTNSIRLEWSPEVLENTITYYIAYQGVDTCPEGSKNSKRLISNGFVSTTSTNIVLQNLIPYTGYIINISTALQEEPFESSYIRTLETPEPSLEELPLPNQIKPSETSVNVTWEPVECGKDFGRLIHTLIVSNTAVNFTKEISLQTNTSYIIDGLKPYTRYTLTILTARNGRNLYKRVKTSNYTIDFMTMAGVAHAPENVEIYSMDKNSAYLRYDLPKTSNGVLHKIQVSRCNSLSYHKCKTFSTYLKNCSLWPNKHCVEVNYLQPFLSYTFRLSLKNRDSPSFGKEVILRGYAAERIPDKPSNITYRIVDCHVNNDYCHLNVTWLHPYNQNGSITEFDIVLNSSDVRNDTEQDKYIHEVYKITNHTYYHDYTYQIKYLPYSSYYKLYIRSINDLYKSDFAEVEVKTDDLGHHIDQSPKLVAKSDSSLLFKIPPLDKRLDNFTLTVIVQDYDKNKKIGGELLKNNKIANNLCNNFGNTWISRIIKVDSNETENVMIGNEGKEKLQPNTRYCIVFIFTNRYKGSEHDVVYYEKIKTANVLESVKEVQPTGSYNHLYMLLLILLVVPIGFLIYRYFRKKRYIKQSMMASNEQYYETLPCDEIRLKRSDSQ